MPKLIGTDPEQVPLNQFLGSMAYQDSAAIGVVDIRYSGSLTGGTGVVNLGSGQFYKSATGDVGIGTSSPGTKLQINKSGAISQTGLHVYLGDTGANNSRLCIGTTNSVAAFITGGSTTNPPFVWYTNDGTTEQMRLDSIGTLGLGVTPSNWSSGGSLELAGGKVISFASSISNICANAYFNSGFKYTTTAPAALYSQNSGQHQWSTAPSGTAGTAISFTQAMTLDATGNLGIGAISPVSKLQVAYTSGVPATALITTDAVSITGQSTAPGHTIIVASSSSAGHRGVFKGVRSGGTLEIPTAASLNDNVLSLLGAIYDGSTTPATAAINFDVDGAVSVGVAPQRITFLTGTTNSRIERMRLDSSGNLGLGVTPSASTARMIQMFDGGVVGSFGPNFSVVSNATFDSAWKYVTTAPASHYRLGSGQHVWFSALSGTAGATTSITNGQIYTVTTLGSTSLAQWQAFFSGLAVLPTVGQSITATATGTLLGGATVTQTIPFAQTMTLDVTGNLGVGVASPLNTIQVHSASNTSIRVSTGGGVSQFRGYVIGNTATDSQEFGSIKMELSGGEMRFTAGYATWGGLQTFYTNGTERARIDSSGNLLVGTTSNPVLAWSSVNKVLIDQTATDFPLHVRNSSTTAANNYGIAISFGGTPNGTGNAFVDGRDATAQRFALRSNGGLANYSANNVALSDQRLKTDIQLATSYLDKICAIPVKTFLYKDQTDTERNLGVIAQDVDAVAPELIDHSGFGETPQNESPYLAVYQTDLQYALMKCIQEQQAIITALTARVAALEA